MEPQQAREVLERFRADIARRLFVDPTEVLQIDVALAELVESGYVELTETAEGFRAELTAKGDQWQQSPKGA